MEKTLRKNCAEKSLKCSTKRSWALGHRIIFSHFRILCLTSSWWGRHMVALPQMTECLTLAEDKSCCVFVLLEAGIASFYLSDSQGCPYGPSLMISICAAVWSRQACTSCPFPYSSQRVRPLDPFASHQSWRPWASFLSLRWDMACIKWVNSCVLEPRSLESR